MSEHQASRRRIVGSNAPAKPPWDLERAPSTASVLGRTLILGLALLFVVAPLGTARAGDVPIRLAQAQQDRPVGLLRSLFGAGKPKQRQDAGPERRVQRAVQPQRREVRTSRGDPGRQVRKRPAQRQAKRETEQTPARSARDVRPPRRQLVRREAETAVPAGPASGTFRTLCVRTCDGYYFPISFSTTRDRFGDDQKACEALCPAADVALYYHDVVLAAAPDGDQDAAAAMMSMAGEPYGKLPTAFSYRSQLDETCTCGGPGGSQWPPGGGPAEPAEAGAQPGFAPLPVPRPDPSEDPETLANRDGGFLARDFAGTPLASADPPGERPVRIVWPAYGIDPEKGSVVLRQVSE